MSFLLIGIQYLISFCLGYLILRILIEKNTNFSILLQFFISIGLGLGLSGFLVFLSLVALNQLQVHFVLFIHILIILSLSLYFIIKKIPIIRFDKKDTKYIFCIIPIIIAILPFIIIEAQFNPFGGWDAWSIWNLKAKFILLGKENWSNIFKPSILCSNPHYPILLPCINAWVWSTLNKPIPQGPMITGLFFTFSLFGILFESLRKWTSTLWAAAGTLFLISSPFFIKLAINQYCDIIIGFYLLCSFIFILYATSSSNNHNFYILCGICLGLLSFSKNEGLVLAALIGFWALIGIVSNKKTNKIKSFICLTVSSIVALIPFTIFQLLYSSKDITFINGLTSTIKPVTLNRLKIILFRFYLEFKQDSWNGLLILIFIGVLIILFKTIIKKNKSIFQSSIIPSTVLCYLIIIIAYYFTNTLLEPIWWMNNSLNRILFTLIPSVVLWIGLCLESSDNRK